MLSGDILNKVASAMIEVQPEASPRIIAMEHCVKKLKPRHRTLLELRHTDGLDVATIAKRVGVKPNTISVALYKIRTKQSECISAWHSTKNDKLLIVIPRPMLWSAAAALLMICLWVAWLFVPQPKETHIQEAIVLERSTPSPVISVATLEGQSDASWTDGKNRVAGDTLTDGDFSLSEGSVRLRFKNNALVVIEAPARFSLIDAATIMLEEGRLVSHCDEQAQGFLVRTPYGDFIDLGTEFGVSVRPWEEAQLHVFQGMVQVVLPDSQGKEADGSQIIHTSEAIAIGPTHSQTIQPLDNADPELFKTTRRQLVADRNTGSSMSEDGIDQIWFVNKLNQNPIDPPLPAVLFVPPTKDNLIKGPVASLPEPIFLPNRSGELCWIKPDPSLTQQDIATTTYTTSFSLEGYDASSAILDMGLNADNFVSAIRLNGQSIPIPQASHTPDQSPYAALKRIKIQEAFLPGHNQIEIVVTNGRPKARPTYIGLVAELSITAQPDWIAAIKEGQIPN
eukprot:g14381.t1